MASSTVLLELGSGPDTAQIGAEVEPTDTSYLPPVDSGRAAWLFLAGSFCVETLIWAVSLTSGKGLLYLGAPPVFLAFQKWPKFLHRSLIIGLPIVVLAVFLSSFATATWHLILTQGILYAIGGNLLYYPIYVFIDEWFVRRKGLAYGVMWAGSGCGGLAGPLVLNWGLKNYDAETFLRGWAVALLLLVAPFLLFIKARLPLSRHHQVPVRTIAAGFGFLKTKQFWAIETCNIIQGLGYFIPALYLPTYARLNNSDLGSFLVSLLNIAQVPGVMFLSMLSDRVSVYTILLISSLGSTLSVFLLWGLSGSSTGLLVAFALCYGAFAGGFTAVYAGAAKELRRVTPGGETGRADLGSMLGLLGGGRGIGNVACGPVSEALLRHRTGWKEVAGGYYGSFGPLIIFAGTTAALTMSAWIAKVTKLL
ncbi:hypothetical protein H2204_008815 [Knufia peltigerae]|uniref:MFS general substrate transporter n=1 Tax=Knufia peltigerae TaxID=1002370 RepID=A0AA38XZA3_9EURO|nr:hypothetical protein H2204_008815 [Knufia peltigerae]